MAPAAWSESSCGLSRSGLTRQSNVCCIHVRNTSVSAGEARTSSSGHCQNPDRVHKSSPPPPPGGAPSRGRERLADARTTRLHERTLTVVPQFSRGRHGGQQHGQQHRRVGCFAARAAAPARGTRAVHPDEQRWRRVFRQRRVLVWRHAGGDTACALYARVKGRVVDAVRIELRTHKRRQSAAVAVECRSVPVKPVQRRECVHGKRCVVERCPRGRSHREPAHRSRSVSTTGK